MALMTPSLMLRAADPSVSQTTQRLHILSGGVHQPPEIGLPILAGVKHLTLITTGEKREVFFLEK